MMLLPILASAEPVEVDGLNYLLNEEEKTATVTSSNYEGFLKIPETIQVGYNEYTVTAIADNALWFKDKLLSVSLPKSLKTIGARAFYYCSGLTSIKIGDGLEGIGEEVFAFCRMGAEVPDPSAPRGSVSRVSCSTSDEKILKVSDTL